MLHFTTPVRCVLNVFVKKFRLLYGIKMFSPLQMQQMQKRLLQRVLWYILSFEGLKHSLKHFAVKHFWVKGRRMEEKGSKEAKLIDEMSHRCP